MAETIRQKALLAAAKAHDQEEAAQKGEPSPWTFPEAAGDEDWRAERMAAMECGIRAFSRENHAAGLNLGADADYELLAADGDATIAASLKQWQEARGEFHAQHVLEIVAQYEVWRRGKADEDDLHSLALEIAEAVMGNPIVACTFAPGAEHDGFQSEIQIEAVRVLRPILLPGSVPSALEACATEGCGRAAVGRFEAGGVGSRHCQPCLNAIHSLRAKRDTPAIGNHWHPGDDA